MTPHLLPDELEMLEHAKNATREYAQFLTADINMIMTRLSEARAENVSLKKDKDHAREVIGQAHSDVHALRSLACELARALAGIIEIGKRDMTNPKYDSYFDRDLITKARAAGCLE